MPQSDPAYPILTGILGIVPAARWTFARAGANGELASLFGSHANGDAQAALETEFRRQRAKAPKGPRIAAMLGPLDEFASGITLLFADAQTNFGILTLLRTEAMGPFTSSEISMLTLALGRGLRAVLDAAPAAGRRGRPPARGSPPRETPIRSPATAPSTCWTATFRSSWRGTPRISAASR